jgi:hypothetical protein
MPRQLNVSSQNAMTLAEIRRTAASFASGDTAKWLHGLLQSRGMNSRQGVLVKLNSLPDQGGELYKGTWLSSAQEFWEFTVLVARSGPAFPEVESFENVTHAFMVSPHLPGTGQSFGYLAHTVLREVHDG